MSHTQVTELANWAFPNVCAAILFVIPAHDANEILMYAGYAAKTLTFIGAMTVNIFAVRHYYLQIKKSKQ